MGDTISINQRYQGTITRQCTSELRWRATLGTPVLEQKWQMVSSETGVHYEWHPVPEVGMFASEEE